MSFSVKHPEIIILSTCAGAYPSLPSSLASVSPFVKLISIRLGKAGPWGNISILTQVMAGFSTHDTGYFPSASIRVLAVASMITAIVEVKVWGTHCSAWCTATINIWLYTHPVVHIISIITDVLLSEASWNYNIKHRWWGLPQSTQFPRLSLSFCQTNLN